MVRNAAFSPHFLVISLGNPLPKYASLHSAGHFVLRGVASVLSQPTFQESTVGRQKCLASRGPKFTLIQSPTLMNVSGPFVSRAWQETARLKEPTLLSLVVIHDELERDFDLVNLVPWDRSPRGHNGIKSVKKALSQEAYPQSPFARISIGIGRPEARDAATVSNFVLAKIQESQRKTLEEETPHQVVERLTELEEEWKRQFQDVNQQSP